AGCPAAQSFHKAHQATGRSLFGYVMDATPTPVVPPVHALWLVGKLLKHVGAAAQPHSDLLRFPKPALMGRFLLACVGKPIAVTAGEQASGSVQLGDPATAIHPVCSDRTHKPRPLSTEPARRPFDGDPLLDVAPILAIRAASVFQRYGVALGFDVDGRHPLALPGPGPREPPGRLEIATPMPFQHVDGPATLDGGLSATCIARHPSLHCSSPNNRNRLASSTLPFDGK